MTLAIIIAAETSSSFTAETFIPALYVFALAAFLGYQVISRVPPLLHTPLMSATNAISGISLVGSIVTAGAQYNLVSTILGVTAVTCATINVVGGFMITDRMLRMFKRKIAPVKELAEKDGNRDRR
jgi:NAD(P) transhydrogenase subunit alpha